MTDLHFQLSPNCKAEVSFTGTPTQEAIEKLLELLEASKETFPTQADAKQTED